MSVLDKLRRPHCFGDEQVFNEDDAGCFGCAHRRDCKLAVARTSTSAPTTSVRPTWGIQKPASPAPVASAQITTTNQPLYVAPTQQATEKVLAVIKVDDDDDEPKDPKRVDKVTGGVLIEKVEEDSPGRQIVTRMIRAGVSASLHEAANCFTGQVGAQLFQRTKKVIKCAKCGVFSEPGSRRCQGCDRKFGS